jgi:branched-chain amino acid transport system ATP-binding protein
LYAYYGNARILKGISLHIYEKEIVTLLGANGAGKTTTVRTISGMVKQVRGSLEFLGESINAWSSKERVGRGIIRVPEGRELFGNMSVLENLELGAYLQTKRKLSALLNYVFHHFPILEERAKQKAGSLSGGEQQMLAIGRGLMSGPVLFLLDEPSLGLAPILVTEIVKIINEINKDGTTIFLVEQNAKLGLKISRRGYILETGEITLEGEAKDLISDEYVVKAYLGA